jgi:hypothetical protein
MELEAGCNIYTGSFFSSCDDILCKPLLLIQQQAWQRGVRAPTCRITELEIKTTSRRTAALALLQTCQLSFVVLPSWLRVSLRAWMFLHDFWRLSNDSFWNVTVSFTVNPFVLTKPTGKLLKNIYKFRCFVHNSFSLKYIISEIVVSLSKRKVSWPNNRMLYLKIFLRTIIRIYSKHIFTHASLHRSHIYLHMSYAHSTRTPIYTHLYSNGLFDVLWDAM